MKANKNIERENIFSNVLKFFGDISHTGEKPFPLYPKPEKISSTVSHLRGKPLMLYFTPGKKPKNLNNCVKINLSAKSVLLMNPGSQVEQLDEIKWR
jgi:hypothetical protein